VSKNRGLPTIQDQRGKKGETEKAGAHETRKTRHSEKRDPLHLEGGTVVKGVGGAFGEGSGRGGARICGKRCKQNARRRVSSAKEAAGKGFNAEKTGKGGRPRPGRPRGRGRLLGDPEKHEGPCRENDGGQNPQG